jgi:hypothetical protein
MGHPIRPHRPQSDGYALQRGYPSGSEPESDIQLRYRAPPARSAIVPRSDRNQGRGWVSDPRLQWHREHSRSTALDL